ncbi:MAG: glycosyltransferase family 9 protein [Deltaproteobacteria bacterium]|nr:glycosyltransferase family 9 protein [Deltaproteobacteria bacterium]
MNCFRLLALRLRYYSRTIALINLDERLGDILACEPIARHVKHGSPDTLLFWAVGKPYVELLETNPSVDKVITVRCFRETSWLWKVGFFDEIVDLSIPGRGCCVCEVMPKKENPYDTSINLINYRFFGNTLLGTFCRCAGIRVLDETPQLFIPAAAGKKVSLLGLKAPYVVVHCESPERGKNWPIEKWLELITALQPAYFTNVVEVGLKPIVSARKGSYVTDLTGRLSIMETAEVIRRAALFVGIDSGPAHLANSVGTPAVIVTSHHRGLFMPFTGNFGSPHYADILFSNGPISKIDVETILRAIARRLEGVQFSRGHCEDRRTKLF